MKYLIEALQKKKANSLIEQIVSMYEYSRFIQDKPKEKAMIDKFYRKYMASYSALRNLNFIFFPYGDKETMGSGLWFDAYYLEDDRELDFPRGWMYHPSKENDWILLHEIGHVWHLEDKSVLKGFESIAEQMNYLDKVHSNEEHKVGELFADAVAEYIMHPKVLEEEASDVFKFIKSKIK